MFKSEIIELNMGPQHPSTHGVLRLKLKLDGETIVDLEPVVGYLHRGIEKMAENMTYRQGLNLTDRLDYIAAVSNNLGYIETLEKLGGIEVPRKAKYFRTLLTELTRIASHLLWLATHALDIGAMTVFLYAFREREVITDIYEKVAGARMTSNYIRIGGVTEDFPDGLEQIIRDYAAAMPGHVDEYEGLLTGNKIWQKRTMGVGVISAEDAIDIGLTGPSLRASGVDWDLRRDAPYCGYETYDFDVPVRTECDTFARYKARLDEMRQCCRIINQALDRLKPGPVHADCPKIVPPPKESVVNTIEGLISHFKIITEGFKVEPGEVYVGVEAPKGELGYYIVSDGSPMPYRMKIRPPSFVNLQALPQMVEGRLLADVIAIIGTLDIVLGEIDR